MKQQIKTIAYLALAIALLPQMAIASGDKAGNGGNVILCPVARGKNIVERAELLDYFELRQRGETLRLNAQLGSYTEILKDLFARWKAVAPKRMAQYEQWLADFPNDAGIYADMQITPTEDTGTIDIPRGCVLEPSAFQRPDEQILPGVKRYTINKQVWDLMSEVQKAGLVLHELIYREGIKAQHATSFAARYFNGYLASAEPNALAYSMVVNQLPLWWTEFGGGISFDVLSKNEYGKAERAVEVTSDGYIKGRINNQYLGIVGDISSEHLKVEFDSLSPKNADTTGEIELAPEKFYLWSSQPLSARRVFVSLPTVSLDIVTPLKRVWKIDLDRKYFFRVDISGEGLPEFLEVNPTNSFFVQEDGSVIRSIAKVMLSPDGPEHIYGLTIITAAGETWTRKPYEPIYKKVKK